MLLAEDVQINREIIAALLKKTKATIDFAVNGAEALAMAENNPEKYSVILMDIQMPEMDGIEATRKIRALGTKVKDVPIIAVTAHAFREDVLKCSEAGMNDHIGKPVNVKELLSKIDKYISVN